MDECIELERFYVHLTESPYAFTTKKTMIPDSILKNKNIKVNKWGYVIREYKESERIEENYYNWKNGILTKLRKNYYDLIVKVQQQSLLLNKMIKEPRGLDAWI